MTVRKWPAWDVRFANVDDPFFPPHLDHLCQLTYSRMVACSMDNLEKILAKLSHLNLRGDIVDKQAHASGLGGSCDVYSAWSTRYRRKVAVKQIRAFLKKDISLAKVTFFVLFVYV